MKNSLLVIFISVILLSCTKKVIKNENQTKSETSSDVVDSHNASNSLDYFGVYKGIIPCADCSGIETILELKSRNSFKLTTKYLDTDDKGSIQEGTFVWNKEGNTILLSGLKEQPNQFFVGENQLIMLDMQGKKINGDLADNYILKKEQTTMQQNSLTGLKFKLIELNQMKINDDKKFFINFFEENRFSAFAGCNNLGGDYKVENTFKITFSKVISTMMACPDMKTEQEFSKMLEMTDNFIVNGKILSLNKGRMTPLARFELVK